MITDQLCFFLIKGSIFKNVMVVTMMVVPVFSIASLIAVIATCEADCRSEILTEWISLGFLIVRLAFEIADLNDVSTLFRTQFYIDFC